MKIIFFLIVSIILMFTSNTIPTVKKFNLNEYKLIWSDEFNSNHINENIWSFRNTKRADAISTKNNIQIKNGKLIIHIFKKDGMYYTSDLTTESIVDSKKGGNKIDFLYGYFEIKMKLPKGVGNNPAFWLNSKGMIQGITGDLTLGGAEIDIFEHSALHPNEAVHTIWINGYGKKRQSIQSFSRINNLSNGWHIFGLLWEPHRYTFFIDGKQTFSTTKNISSSREYLCISNNVHMNNKWIGDIRNNIFLPTELEVEYIRVFQK